MRYLVVGQWFCTSAIVLVSMVSCGRSSADDVADGAPLGQVVGRAPPAVGGTPSVVTLEPAESRIDATPDDTLVMDQINVAFTPGILVAQVGQVVKFKNSEEISHNVRAVNTETGTTVFNVATDWREEHHHGFATAGEYTITCDIHPAMRATVLVVETPYSTVAATDGTFSFSTVPAGDYTLRVWSADTTSKMAVPVAVDGTPGQLILDGTASSEGE